MSLKRKIDDLDIVIPDTQRKITSFLKSKSIRKSSSLVISDTECILPNHGPEAMVDINEKVKNAGTCNFKRKVCELNPNASDIQKKSEPKKLKLVN